MSDNIMEPFELPANMPKDIVMSDGFNREILIKNHFSINLILGPILLAVGVPLLFFMGKDFLTSEVVEDIGSNILGLIVGLICFVGGGFLLYYEIRNHLTSMSLIVDNDSLKVKLSNMSEPVEIQRGLNMVMLVDGLEMYNGGSPTHRIIPRLKYRGEIVVNFGPVSKKQYLWLKELFLSYFKLKIEYENEVLEKMKL